MILTDVFLISMINYWFDIRLLEINFPISCKKMLTLSFNKPA